uniref:Uncharacterized protein n=1 Tax=Rangifer tarandus platyrhynchus TaxID=3082113 RepID=A0ACB0EI95_RANTA|nr:unnamed protein product [Rangifer tarandus platyrhynchus]
MKILSEKVVARGAGGREEGCEGSEKVARKREGWYSLQRDPGTPAGLSRGTSCRTAIPVLPAWKPCRICGDFRSQVVWGGVGPAWLDLQKGRWEEAELTFGGISRSGGRHPEKFSFDVCGRRGLGARAPGPSAY